MMLFFSFGTVLLSIVMSIWNLYQQNFDTTSWFLPYYIILPIDKSTIFGWYCELFLQIYSGYAFVLTITSTVTFFGGCSFYIEACQRQFKHMFVGIDEQIQNAECFETIQKSLFETIVFHNKIFEVFDMVSKIYSMAIFFHLICNVIFFAGALYQTEMVCARKASAQVFRACVLTELVLILNLIVIIILYFRQFIKLVCLFSSTFYAL